MQRTSSRAAAKRCLVYRIAMVADPQQSIRMRTDGSCVRTLRPNQVFYRHSRQIGCRLAPSREREPREWAARGRVGPPAGVRGVGPLGRASRLGAGGLRWVGSECGCRERMMSQAGFRRLCRIIGEEGFIRGRLAVLAVGVSGSGGQAAGDGSCGGRGRRGGCPAGLDRTVGWAGLVSRIRPPRERTYACRLARGRRLGRAHGFGGP